MKRILIAGVGNIFMGDDAFGCEVVAELARRKLPEGVRVTDFGIRSYDLAFALSENQDLVVLVDAVSRGETPGTTYLLELEPNDLPKLGRAAPDAHSLNPVSVLQLARRFSQETAVDRAPAVFLVGCEPAVLETEQFGLSNVVRAAVPQAVKMIEELVTQFLGERASGAHGVPGSLKESFGTQRFELQCQTRKEL